MTAPIVTTANSLEGQIFECITALEAHEEASIFYGDKVKVDPDFETQKVLLTAEFYITITYNNAVASFTIDPDRIPGLSPG